MNAFSLPKIARHARDLMYGNLTCLGRHAVTGMLTAGGHQFEDWTSFYRMFSKQRIDVSEIFKSIITQTLGELDPQQKMILATMDDTIVKKTGKKIPGTAWRRDPLGPPFHTNFIWGQRFIQVSMSLPEKNGLCQARSIPISFYHCPTPKKPKKGAADQQIKIFKEHQKQANLSRQGSLQIKSLREHLDEQKESRTLCMSVDGSYTNATVLKQLPENTVLIGRMRKDSKLYKAAEQINLRGRKKVYGDRIPTPEEIRKSDEYEWQEVEAWAGDKIHKFNVKVVRNLKWRPAGEQHLLQLMVIRPLGYRPNKNSKLLYRQPAYLICTDNDLNAQDLLQTYIWRWEIEVNNRDEKTLLGCGEAQVRNENSAAIIPSFVAATYSLLLLASHKAFKDKDRNVLLPRPRWYTPKKEQRFTTGDILNHLRIEAWATAFGMNFSGFVKQQQATKSRRNTTNPSTGAIFYSRAG